MCKVFKNRKMQSTRHFYSSLLEQQNNGERLTLSPSSPGGPGGPPGPGKPTGP